MGCLQVMLIIIDIQTDNMLPGIIRIVYKGSAWVPAFAETYAPGRAGQHFELFDSILGRVKKSHHTQSQSARTVWKVMPRVR